MLVRPGHRAQCRWIAFQLAVVIFLPGHAKANEARCPDLSGKWACADCNIKPLGGNARDWYVISNSEGSTTMVPVPSDSSLWVVSPTLGFFAGLVQATDSCNSLVLSNGDVPYSTWRRK